MRNKRRPGTFDARAWTIQVLFVIVFFGILAYLASTAWSRMQAQGIAYGFDVLTHPTGWKINSAFLSQKPEDPYWWTLFVAFINTAGASLIAIAVATLLGFVIGIGFGGSNKVIAMICRVYSEVFRNVPLILQAVFWYIAFTSLPSPRESPPTLLGMFVLTNQGLYFPSVQLLQDRGGELALALGAVLLVAVAASWIARRRGTSSTRANGLAALVAIAAFVLLAATGRLPLALDRPKLEGFAFSGGVELPLELLSLVYAAVIFGAAYIAEIVRGGLQAVPRGQIEAANALGLSKSTVFLKIKLPTALRSIVPSLANQFLFLVKATAIGAAIGYSDLFAVSVVAISQTGQAIEFVFMMMLNYFVLNFSIAQGMNLLNRRLNSRGARK